MNPPAPAARPWLRVACTPSRALAVSVLIAHALVVPCAARADDAVAREHFRRGVELYDKRHYEAALELFQKAYAEKASPGIKQNIALCLKGLGRPVEAATAFDEALDEGEGTLKPEVRAAMEQELVSLSKIIATIRLKVISSADNRPLEDVGVTVDGSPLSAAALQRPVRLEPGIHVFTAHGDRFADPPQKKLSILAGAPVDATFELGAPIGTLTITPNVPDAMVRVDGAVIPRAAWPKTLTAGNHHVSVSAQGYRTTSADIVVPSGAEANYAIVLLRLGDMPDPYEWKRTKPPPPPKRYHAVAMLAYDGQSFKLAPVVGEPPGGSKRLFIGLSVALRGGYRASKNFALELHGEIGQVGATYTLPQATQESTTRVVGAQLTPGLRFATSGGIRFTTAAGVGIHGLAVTSEIARSDGAKTTTATVKGSGIMGSLLLDMGMQLDIGPIFFEGLVFADVHWLGSTRDDSTNERMLLSSPSARFGIRGGLGIPF